MAASGGPTSDAEDLCSLSSEGVLVVETSSKDRVTEIQGNEAHGKSALQGESHQQSTLHVAKEQRTERDQGALKARSNLPHGWVRMQSKSDPGKYYYAHLETKRTQLHRPSTIEEKSGHASMRVDPRRAQQLNSLYLGLPQPATAAAPPVDSSSVAMPPDAKAKRPLVSQTAEVPAEGAALPEPGEESKRKAEAERERKQIQEDVIKRWREAEAALQRAEKEARDEEAARDRLVREARERRVATSRMMAGAQAPDEEFVAEGSRQNGITEAAAESEDGEHSAGHRSFAEAERQQAPTAQCRSPRGHARVAVLSFDSKRPLPAPERQENSPTKSNSQAREREDSDAALPWRRVPTDKSEKAEEKRRNKKSKKEKQKASKKSKKKKKKMSREERKKNKQNAKKQKMEKKIKKAKQELKMAKRMLNGITGAVRISSSSSSSSSSTANSV